MNFGRFDMGVVASLLVAGNAWAGEPPPREKNSVAGPRGGAPNDSKERKLTIVAGVSLEGGPVGGGVRVTVEGKLGPKAGLAGGVGAAEIFLGAPTYIGTAGIISVSPRYYVVGRYDHGMQLGGELLGGAGSFKNFMACPFTLRLSDNPPPCANPETVLGLVAIVPYVGYKYTAPVGFTVEVQGGVGAVASAGGVSPWTKANLNVGWAF